MPCYDTDRVQMGRPTTPAIHLQDYSYVSCSLIVYQDGGGGVGGGGGGGEGVEGGEGTVGGGGGGPDEPSTRSCGNDYDDDNSCSWSEEYALSSYAGTSVSSDSGDGWSGDDDVRTSSTGNGGGSSGTDEKKEAREGGGGGTGQNRNKWLKSLWTIVDRMDDRKGRKGVDGKRSPQPVKTILRPPTTYKYVVGMSGFPSKVAVYPKRM